MSHINHDPAYNVTDRDDFDTMIQVERYAKRSPHFDQIIARTDEHFWNPLDPDYVDFSQPFDKREQSVFPLDMVGELSSAIADKLGKERHVEFANESARFMLSQILHGEQGALSLSASLTQILIDPGAVEYAANQVREEARHVTAFTEYMKARFDGQPYPVGQTLGALMREIVLAPEVYKKLVGMQMLIEGLAMGAFASLHAFAEDPLLRRTCQLVMTDEAFHHQFGRIWADKTIKYLSEEERVTVEDWAAHCFGALLYNLAGASQKALVYQRFGLDPDWCMAAMREAISDADRRRWMKRPTSIFRVLIKTLHHAGIISERTRPVYAAWVDMKELEGEGPKMVGDAIAEEGIASLREINAAKKKVVKKLSA